MVDIHTHTHHSTDSRMAMDKAAETILEKKISGICFTDHYDFDAPHDANLFTFDIEAQQKEIDALQKNYPSLLVLKGVEIGIQPISLDNIRELMSKHSFDLVIASMHFVRGTDPYHGNFYGPYNYKEAYSIYLEEILYCIERFRDYDILGHFDYIARYAPYPVQEISMKTFGDILEPILQLLAEDGKTLEINTKTYQQQKHGIPVLDLNVLKRFRELGGEAVALGSDAHKPERLGEQFGYYTQVLKDCGFRYGIYYKERKPQFFKL